MRKVFKIISFVFLGLIIVLVGWESYENRIERIIQKISAHKVLKEFGEKFILDFQINYLNVFPIGKASYYAKGLLPYEGKNVYQLEMEAEDIIPFSWLKPAKAKMVAYLDVLELLPRYLFINIEVNKEVKEKGEIIYYPEEGYIVSEGKRYVILPSTYEPLSLIFYLMRMDFDLHKNKELNLNSNQANYKVNVDVQSKKEYKIGDKIYNVWEVNLSVRRRKGEIMRHSFEAKIYFLEEDGRNIPLWGKAVTNLGNISFRLKAVLGTGEG
ncbi:MAG: DUF3108 domain-containing protein [Candidatus Omnitrophica bacterium]|nr:DUF3108 domain-containing protein [Candidatus Omnitrophota bacterium]